jgi:hypothetical protein
MQEAVAANARICIDRILLQDVKLRYPKATLQAFDFYSPDLEQRYVTARCDALAYRCALALVLAHSVVT